MKSWVKDKAEKYANARYWDRDNVSQEILDIDLKCGMQDYEAGARALLDQAVLGSVQIQVTTDDGEAKIEPFVSLGYLKALFEAKECEHMWEIRKATESADKWWVCVNCGEKEEPRE